MKLRSRRKPWGRPSPSLLIDLKPDLLPFSLFSASSLCLEMTAAGAMIHWLIWVKLSASQPWLWWRPASSCRVHRFFSFLCSDIFGWQTARVIDIFTTPRPKLNFCCAFSHQGSRGDRIMISYTLQILDIIGFHTSWRVKFNLLAQQESIIVTIRQNLLPLEITTVEIFDRR